MPRRGSPALNPDDYPPAMTAQGIENQLVAMAYETARQRFINGTATAQEIVYFLKLGSPRSRLELNNLEAQNQLLSAKTDAIVSDKNMEVLIRDAMNAMSVYKGESQADDENIY